MRNARIARLVACWIALGIGLGLVSTSLGAALSGKVSGTYQTIIDPEAKVSGTWQPVQQVYSRVSGTWQTIYLRFTPVTHTYTVNAPGSGTETIPTNATHLTVTTGGGGAGGTGFTFFGGGGGGCAVKDIAVASADWGSAIVYSAGDAGQPGQLGVDLGEDGDDSTASGTLSAGSVAMNGHGGKGGVTGTGGTATGGDTNTSGGNQSGGTGGAAACPSAGAGGNTQSIGHIGAVKFEWS